MSTSHQDGLDPTGAQTPEAFMELLRQARTASGLSLVEISERARGRGYDLDPVGLKLALEAKTLPTWQTVTGVLAACGLGGMQIDRWIRVYHDLAAPSQPVPQAQAIRRSASGAFTQPVPPVPSTESVPPPQSAAPAPPAEAVPPPQSAAPAPPAEAVPSQPDPPPFKPFASLSPPVQPDPPPFKPLVLTQPAQPDQRAQPAQPAQPVPAPAVAQAVPAPQAVPIPQPIPQPIQQPIPPAAPVKPVEEFIDPEPVSVPPLILSTAPAAPARLGRKHFVLAAAVLAALIVIPLLAFGLFGGGPDTVAAQTTSTPPRTIGVPPAPLPNDLVAEPSPSELATPSTPAPAATTARPSPRTTPSPPAPPSPQPPSPAAPSPADPGIFRSGVVSLSANNGFDLDSGQTDGRQDIARWDGDTVRRLNGAQLERMGGSPNKQACQGVQTWDNWVSNLSAGQWLCVKTSDGRYGRLNITATGDMVKLSYTVWT